MTTSTSQTTPKASSTLVPTDAPAINEQPAELDGTSGVTAEEVRRRGSEKGGRRGSEKRDEIVAQRKGDPSVIVDVPGGLTAEEVEAVGKGVR